MLLEKAQWVQLFAAAVGLSGTLLVYWLNTTRQIAVQRAETYMRLEMEAAKLFEVARNNVRLVSFFNGSYEPSTDEERNELQHQLQWYLPQVLNLFEVSISFYKKKIFEHEIFNTWICWYLEVASAARFPMVWEELRPHYRPELRDLMDAGKEARKLLDAPQASQLQVTRWYFERVSEILEESDVLTYYDRFAEGLLVEDKGPVFVSLA